MMLPSPWISIPDADSHKYEDEYAVEIEKGHPLYGAPVKAIAIREDTGDVLFRLLRNLCEYASVTLTWSGEPETDTTLPLHKLYVDETDLHDLGPQPGEDPFF